MTVDIAITIAIIGLGMFLFIRETFSVDTTSIIIMALFIITGILTPEDGFAGFNHPATMTIAGLFVLSASVFKTGMLNGLIDVLIKIGKIHYVFALIGITVISAFLSAFINDTAVVAVLLPVVLQMARETDVAPSRLLMPLSFGALLGGVCTLIGTSTNILVSGIATRYGLEPLGMFEFSGAALWLTAAGIVYIVVMGYFFLPNRKEETTQDLSDSIDDYVTEIKLSKGCGDIGKQIINSQLKNKYKAEVLTIRRPGGNEFKPFPTHTLGEDNILRIMVSPDNLQSLRNVKGIEISDEKKWKHSDIETATEKLYELIIPDGSSFGGRSISSLKLREEYDANVLAIRKRDGVLLQDLSNIPLREGDMLLVMANPERLAELQEARAVIVMSDYARIKTDSRKALISFLILVAVIGAAAVGITNILISAMVGCLALLIFKIIKPDEAYNSIQWRIIFMLAGVISMGTALEKTGGAALIGQGIEMAAHGFDPRITLGFIFLVTFLLTNIMSNNATAALMAPIAIGAAQAMDLSPKPFLIGVMFAASLSFMTPMGYQTNLMIYSPGNYRFKDYVIFGTPLNIIVWLIAVFTIPLYFPFK